MNRPVAIDAEREALHVGWADVRASFRRWNRDVPAVVRTWMGTSLLVGIALLGATWVVSTLVEPGPPSANFSAEPSVERALVLLRHNALVLTMHALICVAGYMALTSMPIVAQGYRGWKRRLHLLAGPVAIAFVTVVTVGSFALQAWALGSAAPGIAAAYEVPTWQLLLLVTPHALPELTAVFLPLGAWLVLARRREYRELLAASVLSFAVAVPILVMATIVEEWVSPLLIDRFT